MKTNIFAILAIFLLFTLPLKADDDLDNLINKFPSVLTTFSSLNSKPADKKIIWTRSDLIANFTYNQLTAKEGSLLINNTPVVFLTAELSKGDYPNFYERRDKLPRVIYRWEFEAESEGLYYVSSTTEAGTTGFLNNEPILVLSNGIISKINSGKLNTPLTKGKNILILLTSPGSSNQIGIEAEANKDNIKNELAKKLDSKSNEDYIWATTVFFPYLTTLENGVAPAFIGLFTKYSKSNALNKKAEAITFLRTCISRTNRDNYLIEKYFFTNFPDIYFTYNKSPDPKIFNASNFLFINNAPRTIFLQQLIYDGQKNLSDQYFSKCIDFIKASKDISDKEKSVASFYSERFVSYFRIGRIKDANEILKATQEICKPFPLERFIDNRPDQEDFVTLTQSFDETSAFQIKENIDGYDGAPDQMSNIFKIFQGLTNNLVKRNDGAVSLFYYFHILLNENEKLKQAFHPFLLEKSQAKIDKAKETRQIKLLEEVLEQYEMITPLPEVRLILMEEYFENGHFLKALSQAHYLFDKYPQYHSKILSKMLLLENISELPNEKCKIVPENLLKSEVKISGQMTSLSKLNDKKSDLKKSIGKLIATISLEPTHVQYWNHAQIPYYQPIEPIFTKNNIILNGGSYLISYSTKNNQSEWAYHSELEYKKDNENGPHQKRFITTQAGNQLFTLTNRDYSDHKTVKSFDLRGNLLWDISDQKSSLIEEPICTPIESQGKLFCLTYTNRETINVINYAVYDSGTGNLIFKTPISNIPNTYRDDICRNNGQNWNTFTQDNHFVQDGSFVYGYTGTGVIFKADSNSGHLLWEKGFQKPSLSGEYTFWNDVGYAPSGFIHIFDDVLLSFTPDIQMFTALNKNSGEYLWKTKHYNPKFIHDRGKSKYLYFSNDNLRSEPILFKVDPKTGETIWQTSTNGLAISGEGDLLDNKIYIPSIKSILVFDELSGKLLEIIKLNIQPLKIRFSNDHAVMLTSDTAFILQNGTGFDSKMLVEPMPFVNTLKFIEPDLQPNPTLTFENINLETTLKLPEDYFASGDPWKKTNLVKTSKPFHFLLTCKEHLALFREGYNQKDGKYIPPEVLWYGQYPQHAILDDTLIVSDYGKIIATNLFTREIVWSYLYEISRPVFRNQINKITPVIAATKQYIAYQTENQTICVLDYNTRKSILEFASQPIKAMVMEENYIVTLNMSNQARCHDIDQKGKELWTQDYNHNCNIGKENGNFIFARSHAGTLTYYDLKSGKVSLNVKSTQGHLYTMNNWLKADPYIYAFDMVYDSKTGEPLSKYKEGAKVTGGGFIGFFAQYGSVGNYLDNGKEYAFQTQCERDYNNKLFSAARKGNRITFFSSWGVETFEISGDKLVSIDFAKFYSGPYGNHEAGMALFPLDNSFLMLRRDEMYFYKNFDLELNYEKIKSCRVENKRETNWPYSEIYPEIEVTDKNWISYNGEKPKRKLHYQAFGDEKFAYLKFKLGPKPNNQVKSTLYISANGFQEVFAITWDADNWKNCQYTFNIKDNIESWKETDIQGNIHLFIKLQITSPLSSSFKSTLPDFNIELRESVEKQNTGMYRLGGAYFKSRKFFPWMTYLNDEAQTIKDFTIRSNLYENNSNFYPQGDDLVLWLKDRRRFKSIESNIILLNNMLEKNAKNFCVVNILSALLLEEIQLVKSKQPEIDELSDDFSKKLNEIISRLHQKALAKEINKEWVEFALSFWTIEIFPFKFNFNFSRNDFFKAVHGIIVKGDKEVLLRYQFHEKDNILTPNINQPYLEWIIPGLTSSFPKNISINQIELQNIGTAKTGFGRMIKYAPSGMQEFCTRKGKFSNDSLKILSAETQLKLEIKEAFYLSKNNRYDCFNVVFPTRPLTSISIEAPPIKSPSKLENTGQTAESIMTALENLPSDNKNGLMLIDYYISLKGNIEEPDLIKLYAKWLNSMKDNQSATYQAIKSIFNKFEKRKNQIELLGNIIKEAKLTPSAPRQFFIDRINRFMDKNARSVMGPIFSELNVLPETNFNPTQEYKSKDLTYKFTENLENKNGGVIYVASKVTVEDKEKVFLFSRAGGPYYSQSIFSVWVNGKPIVENVNYFKYDGNLFAQRINLNKGENIILFKISGLKDRDWGYYYSIGVGDVYGIPINGVEMKAVHK